MARIGRPRKAEALQKQNISVNIRKTLLSRLNNQLSYNSSRSIWIEDAIQSKLDKSESQTVIDSPTINLLVAVCKRDDLDSNVKFVIEMYLKDKLGVEQL